VTTKANRPSASITCLIKHLYPKANSIISVSKDVNRDLLSRIGKRADVSHMKIVPPPVDIEKALQKPDGSENTQPESNPRINLLAVGRLTKAKGYELLIRAFAKSKAGKVAKLTIVGSGELDASLKDLVRSLGQESNIFLTGKVKDPYTYFNSSDIFILSSLWEGLPVVLLEAMAAKIPRIIASNCPGSMSEELTPLPCVDIFSSGDIESLSQAIRNSINHSSYEKSDYSSLLSPYLLDNVVDKYEETLNEIEHS